MAVAAATTGPGSASNASSTGRTSSADVYSANATSTFTPSRIRVPRMPGMITNRASAGTVYTTVADPSTAARSQRTRCATHPSGTATNNPMSNGTSASTRCSPSSSSTFSRLLGLLR
jgi:hypothetical protein